MRSDAPETKARSPPSVASSRAAVSVTEESLLTSAEMGARSFVESQLVDAVGAGHQHGQRAERLALGQIRLDHLLPLRALLARAGGEAVAGQIGETDVVLGAVLHAHAQGEEIDQPRPARRARNARELAA